MDVNVDETAEEDDEEETGSGCYILRLGIPGIGRSNLWIRKETSGYTILSEFPSWGGGASLSYHHRTTRHW